MQHHTLHNPCGSDAEETEKVGFYVGDAILKKQSSEGGNGVEDSFVEENSKFLEERRSHSKERESTPQEGMTHNQWNESPSVEFRKPETIKKWKKIRNTVSANAALMKSSNPGLAAPPKKRHQMEREDSFLRKFTTLRCGTEENQNVSSNVDTVERNPRGTGKVKVVSDAVTNRWRTLVTFIIDPQCSLHVRWLGIVTLAVLYNLWTPIARQAFHDIREGFDTMWWLLDAACDSVYLLDIVVQMRTSYLERGLKVENGQLVAMKYIRSKHFLLDLFSLLPLDLLQFYTGPQPMLRFPRYLKIYRAWRWMLKIENQTLYPNAWRVLNLTHILFLLSHWFAGFYYMLSELQQFNTTWGYPPPEGEDADSTRKYLRSLYWSTLTLTTIGDLPPPRQNIEYVFAISSYLIGVFVFATIVGQIGNSITNRNATRLEFEQILDNTKNYMRMHGVAPELQKRVMRWYDYAWSRGRTRGGDDINSLGLLPDKLKTELALHVYLETLRRVSIFQECRPEFLHDLVLKMRPYIFTPNDYICRKGEIAREMFIIADGLLEVLSDTGEVLKQMGSGDFFGEIGILNLDGGINRRTADVKSVGYSEIFVLIKEDVLTALKDHPDAEELITHYGRKRLQEIQDRRIQKQETSPPSAIQLAFNMLPGISKAARQRNMSTNSHPSTGNSVIGLGPKQQTMKSSTRSSPFSRLLRHINRKKHPQNMSFFSSVDSTEKGIGWVTDSLKSPSIIPLRENSQFSHQATPPLAVRATSLAMTESDCTPSLTETGTTNTSRGKNLYTEFPRNRMKLKILSNDSLPTNGSLSQGEQSGNITNEMVVVPDATPHSRKDPPSTNPSEAAPIVPKAFTLQNILALRRQEPLPSPCISSPTIPVSPSHSHSLPQTSSMTSFNSPGLHLDEQECQQISKCIEGIMMDRLKQMEVRISHLQTEIQFRDERIRELEIALQGKK